MKAIKNLKRKLINYLFKVYFYNMKVVLILLLLAIGTKAQVSLDLNSAISEALENNHNVKIAQYTLETAEKDVSEAYGFAYPRLDFNAQYNRAVIKPKIIFAGGGFGNMFPEPLINAIATAAGVDPSTLSGGNSEDYQAITAGSNNNFRTTLELTQPIFNYSVFTGIGSSAIYKKVAEESLNSEQSNTVKNTKIAYFATLLSKESVEVVKSSLENAQKRLDEITIMYNEGLISEYEQLRASVQVENLKTELANSETNYINAKNNLKLVIGMESSEDILLKDNFNTHLKNTTVPEFEETYSKLLAANPQLKSLEYQVEVQDAFIDLNRAEYMPRLDLFANYVMQGQSDDFNFFTADQSDIGLRFSMNLFSGFQTNTKVAKAQINKEMAITQKMLVTQSLKNNAENVLLRMKTAKLQIESSQSTVKQAQRAYAISKIRFNEGVGSQIEMNDADLALRQATINYLNASYNYLSARSEYENLIGNIQ